MTDLTPESETLLRSVWSDVRHLVRRYGGDEAHAMAEADVIRIDMERRLPAIEAAARAPLLAERDGLRAALTLSIDFVDRVQTYARMNRQDPRAPGPMETAAAALLTTLRAALTPPAPGVASRPPMGSDCPDMCSRWPGCGHTEADFGGPAPAASGEGATA